VTAAFQEARHFTPLTAERYARLADETAFVCALGEGLPREPVPGVRGAQLAPDDLVIGEWDVVVLAPHFAAALLARDLGDTGPDRDRRFEYALTYRRDAVVRAACALLARVVPAVAEPALAAPLARAA
jgi:DICT domain-containing protein